jgi:hypothetical protein
MIEESPDPLAALRARSQSSLREFLLVDLDLAFTLLDTARIEAEPDPERSRAILAKVETALATVRHLLRRIEDPQVGSEIDSRANELERALREANTSK